MQKLYVLCTSLIFVGLLSPLLTLPARAAESPGVLLSEVDWGGSLRGTADEWLELANLGGSPVDLSGWNIVGAGTSGSSLTLPQGSTIPAYGTFLIANYAPGTLTTLVNQADYVTTAMSLPNSKLSLSLIDASGLVVDSLVDAGTPDYGSTTPIFSSMERNLSTLLWQNPLTSLNLLDATQLGSPGFADVPIPVPAPLVEPTIEPIVEPVIAPISEPITDTLIIAEPVAAEPSQSSALATNSPSELSSPPDFTITDTLTPMPVSVDPVIIPEPVIPTEPNEASTDIVAAPTEPIIDTPVITETNTIESSALSETPIAPAIEPIIDSTPSVTPPIDEPIIEPALETIVTDPIIDSPVIAEPIAIIEPIITPIIPEPIIVQPEEAQLPPQTQNRAELGLILNEFLPSPSTGFDEWVEVYNPNSVDTDVSGWSITDASGKATSLTGTILANSYQTVINPSGKLNNDGDTINLLDTSGQIVDTVSYGTSSLAAPKHDVSLSHSGDTWLLSTIPTPGTANSVIAAAIIEITPALTPESYNPPLVMGESEGALTVSAITEPLTQQIPNTNQQPTVNLQSASTNTAVPTKSTIKKATSITKAKVAKTSTKKVTTPKKSTKTIKSPQLITTLSGVADNILVTYQGIVIATPGTFGKQLAFISGATLFMDKAAWPTLTLGDVVTVTGITSTANDEQRIKLTDASAITITGHAELAASTDLSHSIEPSLITVHGTVVTRNGAKLTLEVDGHDITINAYKTTGIIWSSLTSSELTITGVLRHLNNEDVLMPRSVADVVEDHSATISAVANTKHSSPIPLKPLAGGGLVASSLGALGYWFTKSRTLIPSV